MKVTKWVDLGSQEIEIHIDGADAVSAIFEGSENETSEQLLKRTMNGVGGIMRNMKPETIAGLSPELRAMIRKFCLEQAERFAEGAA